MKQQYTTAPKKKMGKMKSAGHNMGGTFGGFPQKPEHDMPPRTRAAESRARKMRLSNKFI